MALNKNSFLLKDFEFYEGTLDANDAFTGDRVFYTKTGDTKFNVTKTFAQFFNDVPAGLIRMDLTEKQVNVEFSNPQYDEEWIRRQIGGTTVDYPADANYYQIKFGGDEPVVTPTAWKISTKTVDDNDLIIILRSAKIISEDAGIEINGTDHSTMKMKLIAFEDETISDRNYTYGFVLKPKAASSS